MASISLDPQKNHIIHPQKFAMGLFIITVIMIFGGLTSAYIVQRGFVPVEKQIIFDLPNVLWTNLAVLLFSSLTIQWSVISVQRQDLKMALFGLFLTFALGIVFLTGQWNAWVQMTQSGLPMVDEQRLDNSVSFFYIFTGLHGLHIVAGLVVLGILLGQQVYGKATSNPARRTVAYEITAIFWHFLGVLWVYLFVFLLFTQN
jgi:cytochrome c oxidase subunit III